MAPVGDMAPVGSATCVSNDLAERLVRRFVTFFLLRLVAGMINSLFSLVFGVKFCFQSFIETLINRHRCYRRLRWYGRRWHTYRRWLLR